MKIKWVYEGDAGFHASIGGRFNVSPIYCGCTSPQGYELRDGKTSRLYQGFYKVWDAKRRAVDILENEILEATALQSVITP